MINNVTFPDYFIKRKGQVYCNTWHGTPLKSLGDANKFDLYGYGNVTRNFLQADWLIHSNKFTEDVLLDKYHVRHIFNGQSVVTGYPRQDLLIKITDDERLKIRKLIVGDDARPILLYAPTWRDYLSPEEQKIKFLNILGAFDDKKYNVIFKGHQFLEKALRNSGFPSVPKWIDTNELLSVVDVLITDYSSIGIDFLVENKPVFYLVEDFDEYNEKRGVIVNPEDFPGIVVGTLEDLNNKLEELKIESISVINDSYNYIEKDDGNASLRVTNLIFNSKPNPIIYDKPNFLFYPGVLLKNGIGSSFVNLVNSISDEVNVYVITDASHLRRVENKVNMNHILNKIHIIPRVGGFVNSIEDAWIYSKWYASKKSLSTKFDERLKDTFKREWSRIFGDARFSIAINFEGYNRNMTGVFSIYKDNLIVLHNDMLGEYKEKFNYLSMIFELYKNYNKIASVSEATNLLNCKNLSSDYSVRKDNFVCIDNVIDINHILKLSNAPLVADGFFIGKPVFITIGRLSPEKDHQKLIMAFSKVVIKYPDAELLILGDGFLKDELIDLVNYLNLGNSVHFVGIVENPYPWLRRADCFVLSSNHEGQPMVLLEALALNKPIISTDITATHNLLIDTGSLLVNNDVDSLAAGMIDFCKKPFKPANKDLVSYNLNCKKIFFDICNF